MALSLEREPSLEISEWGALGKAHAAGGDQRRAEASRLLPALLSRLGRAGRMPPMTARACAVREPRLPLPCVLKVAQPSWL
jgi:hypothetical protein